MYNRILINKDFARQISVKGYTQQPFLDNKQIEQVVSLYNEFESKFSDRETYNTLSLCNSKERNYIHQQLLEICKPSISRIFTNYKVVLALLYVKNTSNHAGYIHQDPTITELDEPYISVWCPLYNCDSNSGSLSFIPFTHKIFSWYADKTMPIPLKADIKKLEPLLSAQSVKGGNAILFDSRVIHVSNPNTSAKARIAVGFKIVPTNAPLITLYAEANKTGIKYYLLKQPDNFYLHPKWDDSFNMPATFIEKKEITNIPDRITFTHFLIKYFGYHVKKLLNLVA